MVRNDVHTTEEEYRFLFENNPQPMWVYDVETLRFLAVNESALWKYGYSQEEFLNLTLEDIRPPEDIPLLHRVLRDRDQCGSRPHTCRHRAKNGDLLFVEKQSHDITFDGHKARFSMINDITDRLKAEQALTESEARFRTLMESTSAGMFFYRGDHFSFVNRAMEHITGYSKDELLEKAIWELVHPDQRDMVQQRASARKRGELVPSRYNLKINNKQGEIRWLDLAVSVIELGGEKALMGTILDITEREIAEEKLRNSEKRFRALYDHNPLMCFSVDQNGIVQFVNEAAVQQLGYGKEELVGAPVFRVFHEDDKEKLAKNFEVCLNGNEATHSWELRKIHKNGSIIHVSEVAQLVSDPQGNPMVLMVCEDITKRKQLEEQIRSSEELKARILEASQTGVLVVSKEGRIIQANAEAERFYGLPNSELSKFTVHDFVHRKFWEDGSECPFDDFPVVKCLQTATTQGPVTMGIRRLDETMTWAVFTVVPLVSDTGKTNGAVVTFLDITSRKKMEDALRESEATLRALTETTTAAIFFYHDRQFPYVNHAMESITGYTKEELRNMRFTSIVHPDHHEIVRQRAIARHLGKEIPSRYELKILTKQGEVRWLDVAPSVIELKGDNVLMGTAVDITDRKKFEEELRHSEELTHGILEAVPAGIIEVDREGKILQANLQAQRFCGCSALDFFKQTLMDFAGRTLWEDGSAVDYDDSPAAKCLKTGEEQGPVTMGIRRPDGGISWGVFSAVPLKDISNGEATGIVQTFLDITGRKHIEDALRESEERYRKFFEEDLTGDFIASTDGSILACNPAFAAMFGFDSVEAATYSNLNALFTDEHSFKQVVATLRERRKIEYHEAVGRRRDGKPVHVIENLIGLFDNGLFDNELFDNELFGNENNLIGVKGYVFDNTAHKALEQQVQETAKIEGLGRLAGGIAHDFNNLLGIILGYSDRLGASNEPATLRYAQAIQTAANRGASLVKQLLTFARKTEIQFKEMNINSVVDELGKLLMETFPRNITFEVDTDPSLPPIIGDANNIHQAILNLCVNARDAMPSGGTLTLKTETVAGADLRQRFAGAHAERYACVSISDTGIGMDEETRGKIFEPFFSTKDHSKGTGLGLAVVYGIANSHHGIIDVISEPGKGAAFKLHFPIPLFPALSESGDELQEDGVPGGNETILLVEDEDALRDLVQSLLESKGYNLLIASEGEEAVALFKQHHSRIDLVLTDLGLPKLDGWGASKQMKAVNPDLKIIVASGYLDPDMKQEMIESGCIREFVQKPYLPTELTATVRSLLDGTP